jgi:hypothetical protein
VLRISFGGALLSRGGFCSAHLGARGSGAGQRGFGRRVLSVWSSISQISQQGRESRGKLTLFCPGFRWPSLGPELLSAETEPRASERVGEELPVSVGESKELKLLVVVGDVDPCSARVSRVSVLLVSGLCFA